MAATAGAQAAAIAQAIKASGTIVRIDADNFLAVLAKTAEPLVVHAEGGFWSSNHQYLTSCRGLAFFTKTDSPLPLPRNVDVIEAQKIWIPG